jgi:hypothetical protein
MRLRRLTVAVALAATTALTAGGELSAAQAAGNPRVLFGIIDKWKPEVAKDVQQLGVKPGIIGTFAYWTDDPVTKGWIRWAQWVRDQGAAPMFDLMPPPSTTLAKTSSGQQDAHLAAWARAFRDWGHPVLFRLYPEMNATETYRPGTRGQTTTQFIAAWRHVWRLFHGQNGKYPVRAPDVKFVWNPYRPYPGSVPIAKVWPGASYVDWLALDIYNFHGNGRTSHSAYDLTKPAIDQVRKVNKNRPLFIAELGCAEYSGKAEWIKRAYPAMQRLGAKAVVWFNEEANPASGHVNWRYQSSNAALQAARTVLHGPSVVSVPTAAMTDVDRLVRTGSF